MIGGTVDGAFRSLVTGGWANESSGDVEAPCGHFALIDMTTERAMMRDVLEETGEAQLIEEIEPAWYIVVTDSQGFVGHMRCDSEAQARFQYDTLEAAYGEWLGDDEGEGDA